MTYLKALTILGVSWLLINSFIAVHGYDQTDLIDEVIEASQDCTTEYIYKTGIRTGKIKYGLQQLCTEYTNTSKIVTQKTLFIDLENLSWVRLNGWYRN